MTPKKTYAELLKDPRWQKKRLEILNRDSFICKSCGDNEKTLHVHHLVYINNNQPWEYEDKLLITLCEDCHQEIEERQKTQCEELLYLFKSKIPDSFLRGCVIDIFMRIDKLDQFIYSLWEGVQNPEDLKKVKECLDDIFHSNNIFNDSLKVQKS